MLFGCQFCFVLSDGGMIVGLAQSAMARGVCQSSSAVFSNGRHRVMLRAFLPPFRQTVVRFTVLNWDEQRVHRFAKKKIGCRRLLGVPSARIVVRADDEPVIWFGRLPIPTICRTVKNADTCYLARAAWEIRVTSTSQ